MKRIILFSSLRCCLCHNILSCNVFFTTTTNHVSAFTSSSAKGDPVSFCGAETTTGGLERSITGCVVRCESQPLRTQLFHLKSGIADNNKDRIIDMKTRRVKERQRRHESCDGGKAIRNAARKTSASAKKLSEKKTKKPKTMDNKDSKKQQKESFPQKVESDLPWYNFFTKGDEEYDRYMRTEWGFEKRGDVPLFEKISLEGAQSGLSWLTILRKREAYRTTFYGFDIDKVAAMTSADVQRILDTPTPKTESSKRDVVVRHRGKIEAVIHNARCIQQMKNEEDDEGSCDSNDKNYHDVFDKFLWGFVNDKPILNTSWDNMSNNPPNSASPESIAMSKALKSLGFKFVGPTTCYSMMQSVGMVIDHPVNSVEWKAALERLEKRPGGYQLGEN